MNNALQECYDDILETMHGIDLMIEGLQRQGVADGPRVDLLKRRRTLAAQRLREVSNLMSREGF